MLSIQSIRGLNDRILKLPIGIIIFAIVFLNLLIDYFLDWIGHKYGLSIENNVIAFDSVTQEFFLVVLFAPFVETLLFQYLPITSCKKIIKPVWLRVFISALLFGASHFYNWLYVITMFVIGLLFGYVYIVAERRGYFPFFIIVIVHSCYNLTVFMIKHL